MLHVSLSIPSLERLLADYTRARPLDPKSADQLGYTMRLFARWHAAEFGVDFSLPFSAHDVNNFLAWCRELRHNAPKTLNRKRGDLLALWRFAARRGYGPAPESDAVAPEKEPRRIPKAWTVAELARMLEACDALPSITRFHVVWDARHDRALRLVLYETGFRLSATLALEWKNLAADGALLAPAETQKHNADEVRWLSPRAQEALAKLPRTSAIFSWPLAKRAFWTRWQTCLRLAGLPTGRREGPQKMRRTSASHLEARIRGAATAHLGHRSPALAIKNYLDPAIVGTVRACDVLPRIGD